MLYEKDSTKKTASTKAETKQEEYGWGDNGNFKSAEAGKFSSVKAPKKSDGAKSKTGTVVVSISTDKKETENQTSSTSSQGNSNKQSSKTVDQAQKQEEQTGNADQVQEQETQTEPQDKVDDVVMNDIKEELGQDSGTISSENTEDLPETRGERNETNIGDASKVIVGNQSEITTEIDM